jgi:hypothetical protein
MVHALRDIDDCAVLFDLSLHAEAAVAFRHEYAHLELNVAQGWATIAVRLDDFECEVFPAFLLVNKLDSLHIAVKNVQTDARESSTRACELDRESVDLFRVCDGFGDACLWIIEIEPPTPAGCLVVMILSMHAPEKLITASVQIQDQLK